MTRINPKIDLLPDNSNKKNVDKKKGKVNFSQGPRTALPKTVTKNQVEPATNRPLPKLKSSKERTIIKPDGPKEKIPPPLPSRLPPIKKATTIEQVDQLKEKTQPLKKRKKTIKPDFIRLDELLEGLSDVHFVGAGNFGAVFEVNYKGKKCVLKTAINNKERRHEAAVIIKIQSSKKCSPQQKNNIIKAYGISPGKSEEKFIVLEFGGQSLDKKFGGYPIGGEKLQDIFRQILNGTSGIHQLGLEHNDLKPENILIDDTGTIKICDFGLTSRAKYLLIAGTPEYMPPEKLFYKNPVEYKSDSWALGIIFATMCLGYNPVINLCQLDTFDKLLFENSLADARRIIFSKEGEYAADLFTKLVSMNPSKRLGPLEALNHDYFKPPIVKEPIVKEPPFKKPNIFIRFLNFLGFNIS